MNHVVEPVGRMTPYEAEHVGVLAITGVLAAVVAGIGRRIRGTMHENRLLTTTGWIMLVVTVLWMMWGMLPGHWNIDQSLPLHYSDALRLITAITVLARNFDAAECTNHGLSHAMGRIMRGLSLPWPRRSLPAWTTAPRPWITSQSVTSDDSR